METSTTPTTAPQPPNPPAITPLVMNDVDAATCLGMSPHTLRKMRSQGNGPVYIKCGKSVRYRLFDLEAYCEKQKVCR